jgi:hypothetical protein
VNILTLPEFIKGNAPASKEELFIFINTTGLTLPIVYQELLLVTNGLTTPSGVVLYGTEDVIERNETWEVAKYAPGFIAIGDDSGGRVLIMSECDNFTSVLIVDSGDMNPVNATILTTNFVDWINKGLEISDGCMNEISYTHLYDLMLVEPIENGLRGLLKFKKTLNLKMTTGEFMTGSKHLPFKLLQGVPYGKLLKMIEELDEERYKVKVYPSS